jgi:hypothetical protein
MHGIALRSSSCAPACAVELQERMGVSLQGDVWQHQLSFPPRDATAFPYAVCAQIVMILIYNANP